MSKLNFTKMVATGNDFIVIDNSKSKIQNSKLRTYAKVLCDRREGIGADGLLVLEKSKKCDFRMRIFNADGSEAEMCGNGLRCAVLGYKSQVTGNRFKVETIAGIYEACVTGKNRVKINMEDPKDLKINLPIKVSNRDIKVNYIDTGVPHTVLLVEGIEKIDVDSIGREIRYHKKFKPKGTNVDFIEIIDNKNIKMRTYERGVEGETFACGTGAVASALIAHYLLPITHHAINVKTKGGKLKISFKSRSGVISAVSLEGGVKEVYKGDIIL